MGQIFKKSKAMDPIFKPLLTDEEKIRRVIRKEFLIDNGDGTYDYIEKLHLGHFYLKSLKGMPKIRKAYKDVNYSYNQLISLDGSPDEIGFHFECSNNLLTALTGGPTSVGWGYYCSYNKIKTLFGGPKNVGWSYFCSDNPLKTLEGMAEYIGGDFVLLRCPIGNNIKHLTLELRRHAGTIEGKVITSNGQFRWLYDKQELIEIH